ncbi:MAG: GHMP kinase [archaeon]|nr:GHMP kinase [archaeon]
MIISRTPLRMSFVGGGSDFKGYYNNHPGAVVSTALDQYIYITVNKRFIDDIRVGYSQIEEVHSVDEIKHNLVRESLKTVGGIDKSVDIVYMSDMLPANEGSGLGGSSSLTVGTLHALHAFKGQFVSAETLAKQACNIEIDVLGHPIGKQDQYIAAFGGFNYIKFNSDDTVFVNPIILRKDLKEQLKNRLLLFYTNLNTRSDTILTEQKANIPKTNKTLDRMVDLAGNLYSNLSNGDIETFGEILHENWVLKKSLASKVSNPEIDMLYENALNAGAIGGKILGSGGGGFLLFYCKEENQDRLRNSLGLREVSFDFEPEGSKIIYFN